MLEITAALPSPVDLPFQLRGTGSFCAGSESRSRLMFALTGLSGAMLFMPWCFFCWSVERLSASSSRKILPPKRTLWIPLGS